MIKIFLPAIALFFVAQITHSQNKKNEPILRGILHRSLSNADASHLLPGGGFDALIYSTKDPSLITQVELPIARPIPLDFSVGLLSPIDNRKSLSILPGGGFDGLIYLSKIFNDTNASLDITHNRSGSISSSRGTIVPFIKSREVKTISPGGGFDSLIYLCRDESLELMKSVLTDGKPSNRYLNSNSHLRNIPKEPILLMPGGAFNLSEKLNP